MLRVSARMTAAGREGGDGGDLFCSSDLISKPFGLILGRL